MVIVQVNYKYAGDPVEWAKNYTQERAEMFVNLPGLKWKIWLDGPHEKMTGGLYLFEDRSAAQSYVDGPMLGRHKNNPAISELQVRIFDTRDEMTRVTRGPIFGD